MEIVLGLGDAKGAQERLAGGRELLLVHLELPDAPQDARYLQE
jgi:hypothetical protein